MTPRPYDPAIDSRADRPVAGYHALSALAVGSLTLAVLSVMVFVNRSLAVVPLTAIVLGVMALRRIVRTPQELTGSGLAWSGIALAAFFWIAGYGWLIIDEIREVPAGYQRVTYDELQPDPSSPDEPPPNVKELAEKNQLVFLKGYMVPTRQQSGLKQFTLCPTNNQCPYCIPFPKRTEQIRVTLDGDLTADYTTRLIGIGGRFRIDANDPSGIPYAMDVDYLK